MRQRVIPFGYSMVKLAILVAFSRDYHFHVYLGGITLADSEEGRIKVDVKANIVHPNYNPYTVNNDIALLQLSEPVQFTGMLFLSFFLLGSC